MNGVLNHFVSSNLITFIYFKLEAYFSICFKVKYFTRYFQAFGMSCKIFQAQTTKIGGLATRVSSIKGPEDRFQLLF